MRDASRVMRMGRFHAEHKASPTAALERAWRSETGVNWRAAILLGLISSTFSTVISHFVAGRIGRDPWVEWMVVANIPVRDPALQVEPSWLIIAAGILFHQWADFSWEVFFFGLLQRWTATLTPWSLVSIAGPWALFTSAAEWFVFVPLVPFWQPVFPLEQPYWIGLLVHLSSASMYPLFPWLRDWFGRRRSPYRRFAATWSALAASVSVAVIVLWVFAQYDREPRWVGRDEAYEQGYMRRMSDHHRQGVMLPTMAVARASDPHLQALARLMAAEQAGEIEVLDRWWRSWFPFPPAICNTEERANMPGMLTDGEIERLKHESGGEFDRMFVELMTFHHRGAAVMADGMLHAAGADPRLRIMAQATRHGQQGEIEMMRGTHGPSAVQAAVLDSLTLRVAPPPARPDSRVRTAP